MGVIQTNEWLEELDGDLIGICKKLRDYFPDASVPDIHQHLLTFGMYNLSKDGSALSKKLFENGAWSIVQQEYEQLRQLWKGPDVPIFIFPSDPNNKLLTDEFSGKAGLSFQDKLFLFISPNNTEVEIKALLTHEYNHVCRLAKYSKREVDYILLDTVILEGLAEMAVFERFGKEYNSKFLSLYSNEELEKLWREIVFFEKEQLKGTAIHYEVLYGMGSYPKMVGYCVGFYLVWNFLKDKTLHSDEILAIPSHKIAQLSTK